MVIQQYLVTVFARLPFICLIHAAAESSFGILPQAPPCPHQAPKVKHR